MMITVEEACELVLKDRQVSYIRRIVDIERGYVISSTENGEEIGRIDNAAHLRFVDKQTGAIEGYPLPKNVRELALGKKLDIPEKYKMPEHIAKLYEEPLQKYRENQEKKQQERENLK